MSRRGQHCVRKRRAANSCGRLLHSPPLGIGNIRMDEADHAPVREHHFPTASVVRPMSHA